MRRLALATTSVLALTALIACTGEPGPAVEDLDVGEVTSPIYNGTPDTTHTAVVALLGSDFACSGTIVHVASPYIYILTAAHCVSPTADSDPYEARLGTDYMSPDQTFSITDCEPNPNYNQQIFDFAMCRAPYQGSAPPFIPPQNSPDSLSNGTQIRHVGYGQTKTNSQNSIRYYRVGVLQDGEFNAPELIWYDQPNGGPCHGDSGGPQLSMTGSEKVEGVTSFGGDTCDGPNSYGASGRVSVAYDSFIMPYINNTPVGPLTCQQCFDATTGGQGACASKVQACLNNTACDALVTCLNSCTTASCQQTCVNQHSAGYDLYNQIYTCVCTSGCPTECGSDAMCQGGTGGSGAGGSGTGAGQPTGGSGTGAGQPTGGSGTGGGASSDLWVAGDAPNLKYSGDVKSSCAMGPDSRQQSGTWWLWAAAVALGVGVRRRS